MNILLTGAFGNLGCLVLEKLLQEGHSITCFDIKNKVNEKVASKISDDFKLYWGDIRDKELVSKLVQGQDAIIHLAAIIPPFSELNPELSKEVNLTGTETLLRATEQSDSNPIFVFSSSCSVYGLTQDKEPPRIASEETAATDHYSGHKIECENMIRKSSTNWMILRIAGMVDSRMRHSDKEQMKMAFSVAADNRIEFIHPKDAATAFTHAISQPEALRKTLLIGGGKNCQGTHYDFVNVMSEGMGISFPRSYFGNGQFYTDWFDSSEAQHLLKFQNHSLEDLRQEFSDNFKWLRFFVKPFAPFVIRLWPLYLKVP